MQLDRPFVAAAAAAARGPRAGARRRRAGRAVGRAACRQFSKDRALAAFAHARDRYARALGDAQPMVIGTLLRSRGTRAFYRVRVPAASRNEANTLCNRIRASGGACVVLRS